ncbi:AI-2E family transporter [Acinetobacter towneri]|uniref:AI-2E family transporter n=1 Tax=Acinetobacter towneri TaxID=202956 RepID=A0ABX7TFU8_9GAMM|nr:AI-2E family transporter [Acinetobacter towneri]QTD58833.1 AI-2E family transporter [Acinetobacter towneri]QTD62599.1 AI-2E family transporter [Acinetobacter towneri]
MNQEQAWQNTLRIAVYLLLFIILFGWLLKVAQSFLLPVLMSIISVYILATLTDWLGNFPVLKHSPEWMRRLMVLIGFIISMFAFSHILIITGEQILISAPNYQANLEKMLQSFSSRFSWAQGLDLSVLRELIFERISVQSFISYMIGAVSSFTSIVVLIIVYAMFLIAEKGRFSSRLSLAFPSQGAKRTKYLIMNINKKIGDYLAVKTLINIILATISVIILWLFGVEHAIFWALIIGILNYIPYIGSLLGVVFPVTLTLVQFGSIQMTLAVAVLLTMAQMYVGNVLEPKMIGKEINLSPFVVLISLSLWSSLWGISGAILAVPLTSVFVIIFAEFESTRPFTLLLMDDVEQDTDQA